MADLPRERQIYDFGLPEDSLGTDAAGIITVVGRNVAHISVGDRVAVATIGAYRTHIRVDQACVAKIPDSVALQDAATLPTALLMAYHVLCDMCRVNERDSILVCNADSGKTGHRIFG